MLNEAPKKVKVKDYSDPTPWQLFWRIQREGWRRAVTPFLMYLFMSLILLAVQTISQTENTTIEIVIGIGCILIGAFFNGHLCYHYGVIHYDAYLTGCIHRKNRLLGIQSGGDHRIEREYRPWKGFFIGFLVGFPALILAILAGFFYDVASLPFIMFAGWAIIPITWFGTKPEGGLAVSPFWSILMLLLPIIVSGVFYIVGAMVEKKRKEREPQPAEEPKKKGKKK